MATEANRGERQRKTGRGLQDLLSIEQVVISVACRRTATAIGRVACFPTRQRDTMIIMQTAETADQSHELNVCYVRVYQQICFHDKKNPHQLELVRVTQTHHATIQTLTVLT